MTTLPLPIAAFLAGLVSSPCVLPLVPGYVSLISGAGVEELKAPESRLFTKVMLNSIGFILGFSVVFITLGAISTEVGQLLARSKSLFAQIAGVVIILFGLHLTGLFKIKALYTDARLHTVKGGSRRMDGEKVETVSALENLILHDPAVMERLLLDLSINVTAMFRDPTFFFAFREKIVPLLRTYPFARLWVAGCSTGEEVYSLAILLAEEGLADRVRIYATDINEAVIEPARLGVFPLDKMQEYTQNYIRAGGPARSPSTTSPATTARSFARELARQRRLRAAQPRLRRDVQRVQRDHCRNVLIYFAQPLQERVHRLFYDSLAMFGVLALGQKETIRFSPHESSFEALDAEERLFRKVRRRARSYELIAIGASWGGLEAMGTLLEGIPQELDQTIVVAQHRSPEASRGVLESLLQRHVERPVTEPGDKELIEPGRVYVAPADYHLLVEDGHFALSVEARVQYARPVDRRPLRVGRRGLPRPRDRDRAHRREQGRRRRPRRHQAERRCLDRPGSADGEPADDARRRDRSRSLSTPCCRWRRSEPFLYGLCCP